MIMAGEASGQLDKTILKMASYYESESRMRGKIKSAMTYPIFLLSLTVLVVICLFAFVLPKFFTMFKGAALPLPTRIVIAISNFITGYWYVLLVMVILLVMLLKYMLRQYSVQISLDKALLNFPKIGRLFRIVYTARFARTLSALYLSGLPLVNCLQVGYNTIGNKYIISQFTDVINQVKSGKNLSTAIAQLDGFDTILSSYIIIGEESGRLSEMLNSVADSLDYESESAIQRLISLLEPLMIVIMALVVGSIMISVMMPIFSLYQNMEA
jgi:type IV pilus assembly protein PilC